MARVRSRLAVGFPFLNTFTSYGAVAVTTRLRIPVPRHLHVVRLRSRLAFGLSPSTLTNSVSTPSVKITPSRKESSAIGFSKPSKHMQQSRQATQKSLFERAEAFVRQCYRELDREWVIENRLAEISHEIEHRGTYTHTAEELEHGARMAWRNSNRCVGRLFWNSLEVRDCRDLTTAEGIHKACCEHLRLARNGGDIKPLITVFAPADGTTEKVRIWNYQLLGYAGYETPDGIVGDPAELSFTNYCQLRGWEGEGTDFDLLPHVIQCGKNPPELFDVPEDAIGEVPLSHPEYEWFESFGLRWYDVPVVSNMCLEIGGIRYTAAPFNGWYLGTEIGARNLADTDRYDMLPAIAERLGLDTTCDRSLWKDEALVVLNQAVLHSYDAAGVRIADHHTVTDQFAQFERNEQSAGREVTGDWSWLVPPMSPATTQVFHTTYDDDLKTPNFFYQESPSSLRG